MPYATRQHNGCHHAVYRKRCEVIKWPGERRRDAEAHNRTAGHTDSQTAEDSGGRVDEARISPDATAPDRPLIGSRSAPVR